METILTLNDIIQMTQRDGESWAVAHAKRLLELIRQIGQDLPYDSDALQLAAYLHDWGAFDCYAQKGVDHALRSRQVAETQILPYMDLGTEVKNIILEAIELHDYRDKRTPQSNEALLLREADMLEFLGVIGMARDFARGPRDVAACTRRILGRRADIQDRFTLRGAQEIARVRLEHMQQCLQWLEEESYGIL